MSHPHESFPWVMSHSCSNMTTTMLYLYHTWLSPTNYKKMLIYFFHFLEKIRLLIGRPIRLIIPSRSTKRANRVAARKKKRNKMENRIFWVDCEMTGLDYMGKGIWIFHAHWWSEKLLRTQVVLFPVPAMDWRRTRYHSFLFLSVSRGVTLRKLCRRTLDPRSKLIWKFTTFNVIWPNHNSIGLHNL